ncbi:MAG: acyl-CoA reductase [Roseivirga sp.]
MFYALGKKILLLSDAEKEELALRAGGQNNWFTPASVSHALQAIGQSLSREALEQFTAGKNLSPVSPKTIGLVMAGNIPMVGFHDLLSVLVAGHKALIKLSSQDTALMLFLINTIKEIEPAFGARIEITERLQGMDATIATGSDNSARYFKHYFAKTPHIIRQNRTSVAVLKGGESTESILALGNDLFLYYGLGCRNVSKVYVPKGYDFVPFIEALNTRSSVLDHHKYRNNYDYNKSIYLVNREPHLDSGFFMLRESQDLVSPISVIFYESYASPAELDLKLAANKDKIQCTVSEHGWYEGSIPFGEAQQPALWDYADGVDTLEFLDGL